jgi:hypothetical protein
MPAPSQTPRAHLSAAFDLRKSTTLRGFDRGFLHFPSSHSHRA